MGLLDDAIREHLDLKRRRGADPDEVARQENEALGPPRTGQFAAPAEEFAGTAVAEAPLRDDEPGYAPLEDDDEAPAAVAAGRPREDPWLEEPREPELRDDQATTEFAPPDADEPAATGEDVLEETPEFLQETPEHDRLWFEQRPPRDFDFDK